MSLILYYIAYIVLFCIIFIRLEVWIAAAIPTSRRMKMNLKLVVKLVPLSIVTSVYFLNDYGVYQYFFIHNNRVSRTEGVNLSLTRASFTLSFRRPD